MLRRPLDEQETPADHWKNHALQNVKRVPGLGDLRGAETGSAKNRRLWRVLLSWSLVLAFFGLVGAVVWFAWDESTKSESPAIAVTKPKFETDGSLDEAWVRTKVNFDAMPALYRIKEILQDEPQVKEVTVSRQPDGTLLVRVSERTPAARLMVMLPDGTREARLVATDGVIFKGVNIGQMTFSNLPLLEGARPKAGANADYIEGFEPVAKFLTLARERHTSLYREWQRISLRDYPGRPDAPGALLRVRPRLNAQSPESAAVVEILFSPAPERFAVELNDLDHSMRQWVASKLREADRARYPAFVLDMSIWNMSNPRRPYPEPRLIPASVARQP